MAERKSPVRFPLEDGAAIEAPLALYGMKRAHLVEGAAVLSGVLPGVPARGRALAPLPETAEARRAAFDRQHPVASRLMAAAAWLVLAVALATQIPNLANSLANGAALVGFPLGFSLPTLPLPDAANTALGVLGIAAGLDRGLRMVHNPLLDD